jgi:hypothetical protein
LFYFLAGYCSPAGVRSPITFGQDQLLSCYLPMNLNTMKDICKNGLLNYLNISSTVVGQWGNAGTKKRYI